MTYFGFLLRFVVPLILILLVLFLNDEKKGKPFRGFFGGRGFWLALAVHVLLALTYTTPWDNYLVASDVWHYNPALVTGVVIGFVPLEEYTFFVLETMLVGLWWAALARRVAPPAEPFRPSARARVAAFAALFAVWILSAYFFFYGGESFTYLSIIFFWALPALFPQALFGADILWRNRRLLAWTILPAGLYLSATDSLAILASTWTIAPERSTGWMIGALPLEEAAFFFITVVLIGFGMTLALAQESRERLNALKRALAQK